MQSTFSFAHGFRLVQTLPSAGSLELDWSASDSHRLRIGSILRVFAAAAGPLALLIPGPFLAQLERAEPSRYCSYILRSTLRVQGHAWSVSCPGVLIGNRRTSTAGDVDESFLPEQRDRPLHGASGETVGGGEVGDGGEFVAGGVGTGGDGVAEFGGEVFVGAAGLAVGGLGSGDGVGDGVGRFAVGFGDPAGVGVQRGHAAVDVAEATCHGAQVGAVGQQFGRGVVP